MKKWNRLEQTETPDKSVFALYEHDGEYVLRVNGRELMSTKRHASELRLGELGGLAAQRATARVLIGGLGLGFTLRGVLEKLGPEASVVVAELMPEVVRWNKDLRYPFAAAALADARSEVVLGDAFDVITESVSRFDVILLDLDNGTTAMMTAGNRRLYEARGVALVRAALCPGGTVIYWSAEPEPRFSRLMDKGGFTVTTEYVRAYGTGGPKHTLLIGKRR